MNNRILLALWWFGHKSGEDHGIILLCFSYIVQLVGISLSTMVDGHLWPGPNQQQWFMQDGKLEKSHFGTQSTSPMEGNSWGDAHPISSGSQPKPHPVFAVCYLPSYTSTPLDISCPSPLDYK
jgi:hypothetical protein